MILHGVDFSGADGGGHAKIRIAERDLARPEAPIRMRGRVDRTGLLNAVRASRADGVDHLWRIDAPIGVPLETLDACGVEPSWRAMAEWMASYADARAWRSAVRDRSRREPRRACDLAERTPMAPMNLRVFKQTWTLIVEVLLPLVREGAREGVRIEPVSLGDDARVVVCEGCPASVLARFEWPTRGYKGGGEPPKHVRAEIVRSLAGRGLRIPESVAAEAIADVEGDVLDALLLVTDPPATSPTGEAGVEGWVW